MALRKPLVIIAGVVQQISSSDTLDAVVSEVDAIVKQNGNAGAIVAGTPVYVKSATTYDKAQANAAATSGVLGLQKEASVAAGGNGTIQTDGIVALTTAQWDAVAGTTGGLAFGTVYYLDPATVGKITATAPTTVGQYVVVVGRALSTTELDISLNPGTTVLL
jgi:hypothetical protein